MLLRLSLKTHHVKGFMFYVSTYLSWYRISICWWISFPDLILMFILGHKPPTTGKGWINTEKLCRSFWKHFSYYDPCDTIIVLCKIILENTRASTTAGGPEMLVLKHGVTWCAKWDCLGYVQSFHFLVKIVKNSETHWKPRLLTNTTTISTLHPVCDSLPLVLLSLHLWQVLHPSIDLAWILLCLQHTKHNANMKL